VDCGVDGVVDHLEVDAGGDVEGFVFWHRYLGL
jgi:hypothetical protein